MTASRVAGNAVYVVALVIVVVGLWITPAMATPVCDASQALYVSPDGVGCEVRSTIVVAQEWHPVFVFALSALIVPVVAIAVTQVRGTS